MTGLLDRVLNYIASKGLFAAAATPSMKLEFKVLAVTSNSSGLINLTDHGVDPDNAAGITVSCSTSNYKLSNPVLWSNYNYYTVLTPWNSATPAANKAIRMVITWYHS